MYQEFFIKILLPERLFSYWHKQYPVRIFFSEWFDVICKFIFNYMLKYLFIHQFKYASLFAVLFSIRCGINIINLIDVKNTLAGWNKRVDDFSLEISSMRCTCYYCNHSYATLCLLNCFDATVWCFNWYLNFDLTHQIKISFWFH